MAPAPARPERPAEDLLAVLSRDPQSVAAEAALFDLARIAYAEGHYADAADRLKTLQSRFPLSHFYSDSEFWLGLALQAAGDAENAWLPLRGSLSREGNALRRAYLLAALGDVYEIRNDPFAALLSYAEALNASDQLPHPERIKARLRLLAEAKVAQHQLFSAVEKIKQAPTGPILRLALARRAADEGRPQASLAAIRRFLEDYPDHPDREAALELESRLRDQLSVNQGRVGVLLPLSGPAAAAGERVYQGVQLALRHALEQNPKLQIQIAVRDTRGAAGSPGDAVAKTEELIQQEKVLALVGPFLSSAAEAAAAAAARFETPLLTPFAIRTQMAGRGPWFFRNTLTNKLQAEGAAAYAVKALGLRQFAILYPDDTDGRELARHFAESVQRLGGQVAKSIPFPHDANDFGPQMRALGGMDDNQLARQKRALGLRPNEPFRLALPFEALFVPAYHDKAVLIAPQIPFYNMHSVRLLGGHGWNNDDLLRFGERYVERAIFVDGFFPDSEDPRIARFTKEYTQLFGRKPDIFSAMGYDAAKMVFEGLAKGAKTRREMRDYLATLRGFEGIMGLTDMGPEGDALRQLFVLTVRRNKIVHLQMITPHREGLAPAPALPPPAAGGPRSALP
ncbi:MAG: penicillin-binding protein activator [Candidatus Tectomicrobia bacterium]|uniref:Penicillin-binding protein activator n=1 Tax=Tectimicrobiota bacterium TaxID=2528274 RepID=A0A932HZY2_UNCTE|nr:penicillin-binding protein activator [Candidatus Tectomicrobia bacterium]